MYVYLRFKGASTALVIGAHMNDCDDNDGQMIFGDPGDLKFPDICLTGEKNPEKTSPRKLVPTGDRTRARDVTGTRSVIGISNKINSISGKRKIYPHYRP